MLHQAADIRVVQLHGGGGALELAHKLRVVGEFTHQGQQLAVLDVPQSLLDLVPQRVHVVPGGGQKVGRIEGARRNGAHAVDDELPIALVVLHPPVEAQQPALGHGVVEFLRSLPHPRRHLSRAVGDDRVNVEAAVGGGSQVLLRDPVDLVFDPLAGLQFGHVAACGRLTLAHAAPVSGVAGRPFSWAAQVYASGVIKTASAPNRSCRISMPSGVVK